MCVVWEEGERERGGGGGTVYLFPENPGKYMCILYLIISCAFFVFIFYLQDCL